MTAVKEMLGDYDFALPGGESNNVCQKRSAEVLKHILEKYKGRELPSELTGM
jgi:2,3-bisphosphoglycerate-dependent phosphoglycerate mutase